jgi:inosine/xanthosine triphosphatase
VRVVVASTNPVKQEAVYAAFNKAFEVAVDLIGVKAPSEVSDQPMTDEETKTGAINRARNAQLLAPDADYWVGVEGGAAMMDNDMEAFGWMAVLHATKLSCTRSATFLLPDQIAAQLKAGGELGPAMDALFKEHNSKHKGGAVGLLTNGLVTREALYEQPLLMALIPFLKPDLYSADKQ